FVDQRQLRVPQSVDVLEGRAVIDEQALQRGGQQPAADADAAGRDGAEGRRQRWRQVLARDLRGDDLEVDQQAFFVLDDLGLCGRDAEVARFTGALVPHHR